MSLSEDQTAPSQREHKKGLFLGVTYVFASRMLALGMGLALSILVVRCYGTKAEGLVAIVRSSALVFGAFAVLGQNTYLVSKLPERTLCDGGSRRRQLYLRSLGIVLVTSFAFAAPIGYLLLQNQPDPVWTDSGWALTIVCLALVGGALVAFGINVSRSLVPVPVFCVFIILPPLINLAIISAWLLVNPGLPLVPSGAYAFALFASGLLAVSVSLLLLRPRSERCGEDTPRQGSSAPVPPISVLLQAGMPFLIATASEVALTEGALLTAALFLPTDDIGIYSVAVRFSAFASFALTSICLVAQPEFARRRSGDPTALQQYARRVSKLIFFSTLPIAITLFLAKDWLIDELYGPQFKEASSVMAILLAGHTLAAMTGATNPYLAMTGGQKRVAQLHFAAACVSIGLTASFTPRYGTWAPAAASLLALASLNIGALIAIRLRDGFWLCWTPKQILDKQTSAAGR